MMSPTGTGHQTDTRRTPDGLQTDTRQTPGRQRMTDIITIMSQPSSLGTLNPLMRKQKGRNRIIPTKEFASLSPFFLFLLTSPIQLVAQSVQRLPVKGNVATTLKGWHNKDNSGDTAVFRCDNKKEKVDRWKFRPKEKHKPAK